MLALLAVLLTATPSCPPARASASAAACAPEGSEDPEALIPRASALMDAGDWREALALLRRPSVQAQGAAVALLEGICLYELGEDAEARPRLTAARADPELTASADLFLGLLAQREGRSEAAAEAFARVAERDRGDLGQVAGSLLKRSRRDGALSLALSLGGGYDTNPLLLPLSSAPSQLTPDAAAMASAALAFSPLGTRGPFLRAAAQGRRQASVRGFDLAGAQAGGGWRWAHETLRASAEYGWDGLLLGGAPFLSGHQLGAQLGWQPGASGVDLAYTARLDEYFPAASAGYSGVRHAGTLSLTHASGEALVLRLGFGAALVDTRAAELAHTEYGPSAGLYLQLAPSARLALEAHWLQRGYAAATLRRDTQLDASGALELDLSERWSLRGELGVTRVDSNVASQAYGALSGALGLRYEAALF